MLNGLFTKIVESVNPPRIVDAALNIATSYMQGDAPQKAEQLAQAAAVLSTTLTTETEKKVVEQLPRLAEKFLEDQMCAAADRSHHINESMVCNAAGSFLEKAGTSNYTDYLQPIIEHADRKTILSTVGAALLAGISWAAAKTLRGTNKQTSAKAPLKRDIELTDEMGQAVDLLDQKFRAGSHAGESLTEESAVPAIENGQRKMPVQTMLWAYFRVLHALDKVVEKAEYREWNRRLHAMPITLANEAERNELKEKINAVKQRAWSELGLNAKDLVPTTAEEIEKYNSVMTRLELTEFLEPVQSTCKI